MGRYLLKFSKTGEIRFISHLDLLRVFQRAFRRSGIRLSYSNGYNPHAKIGFASPLSLGFESRGDYVEFETEAEYTEEEAARMLADHMPPGIGVLKCVNLKETSKTAAAAALTYAEYTAEYRGEIDISSKIGEKMKSFLAQEKIITEKFSKKKKKNIEKDIRPNIFSLNIVEGKKFILTMMLGAGNNGSLNPQLLVKSLLSFCGIGYEEGDWLYTRKEMYVLDRKGHIMPMYEFEG